MKVLREGSDGVSVGSWGLFLTASVVWAVYGWKIASPSTLIGNVAAGLAFAALVGALLAARFGRGRAAVMVLVAVGVIFAVAALLPTVVVGVIAVLLGFALALPQLVTSWRSRDLPSTVSTTAWAMIATGQGLWLIYGVLRPELAIVIVNVVAGAASLSVLLLERRKPALPQNGEPLMPVRVR